MAHLPHSRACGPTNHEHGTGCHSNCPTCGGQPWMPWLANLQDEVVTTGPAVELLGEGPFYLVVEQELRKAGYRVNEYNDPRWRPGFALAANFQQVMRANHLEQWPGGVWGYHPSLLPRHRGPDAVRATLAAGDAVAGGTVYRFTEQVDAGPVLLQDWCFVHPLWTAKDLYRNALFPMGVKLLLDAAKLLSAGSVSARPQREEFATYHRRGGLVQVSR